VTIVPPKTVSPPPWSSWQLSAACRGQDTAIFYLHERERGPSARRHEAQAKQICATCPVRAQCLAWALESREPWGVWGGLTPSERSELLLTRAEAG
jgi:WhiB family transcriptional regulator, redox-sensing transcriptional regulator